MEALRKWALNHFSIEGRFINLTQRIAGVTKRNSCQQPKLIFSFSHFGSAFRQVPRFGRFGGGRRGGGGGQEEYVSFL